MHKPGRRDLHVKDSLELGLPHSDFVGDPVAQNDDLIVLQGLFYELIVLGINGIGEVDLSLLLP